MVNEKIQNKPRTILKVIILGDGGVGKSSLMIRFVKNSFQGNCAHTVGVEFLKKNIVVDDRIFTLQIWDTAGQERFKSLRTPFYRGADVCLLVFSLTDRRSFENLTVWIKEFLKYADLCNNSMNFPFVVVGNKCDEETAERQVKTEEIRQFCFEQGNLPYMETSAKDSTNVDLVFREAVKFLSVTNTRNLEYISYKDTVNLQQKNNPKKFKTSCC